MGRSGNWERICVHCICCWVLSYCSFAIYNLFLRGYSFNRIITLCVRAACPKTSTSRRREEVVRAQGSGIWCCIASQHRLCVQPRGRLPANPTWRCLLRSQQCQGPRKLHHECLLSDRGLSWLWLWLFWFCLHYLYRSQYVSLPFTRLIQWLRSWWEFSETSVHSSRLSLVYTCYLHPPYVRDHPHSLTRISCSVVWL